MIQVQSLTKKFEQFVALDSVTCTIPSGCIYGLVGSNGAGKSTLLRLLTGVYKPDSGSVTLDGAPVYENPAMKAKIAYIPDELYFLSGATMNRMTKLYASLFDTFSKDRYEFLTKSFNLNPAVPLNSFSKGMRRQAAIILALSCRPDYIFFDETFDGLDPVMRGLVKSLICEDVAERGATAIITSHSLRELEDTCDQLALLHKGGLVMESDIQNLKTSLFKVQIALTRAYDQSIFAGIDVLQFHKSGSVSNMIIRGDREEAVARLRALSPVLLDILPLSLEEVFTFELRERGYSFESVIQELQGDEAKEAASEAASSEKEGITHEK